MDINQEFVLQGLGYDPEKFKKLVKEGEKNKMRKINKFNQIEETDLRDFINDLDNIQDLITNGHLFSYKGEEWVATEANGQFWGYLLRDWLLCEDAEREFPSEEVENLRGIGINFRTLK